jgi:formylglycine-generating enzyme required for sulfatase activity
VSNSSPIAEQLAAVLASAPPDIRAQIPVLADLLALFASGRLDTAALRSLLALGQRLSASDAGPAITSIDAGAVEATNSQVAVGVGNILISITRSDDEAHDVRGLRSPYLGLRSYTYHQRALYAGRRRQIAEAVAKLTAPGAQRVLLFIIGASGAGKSSLVQAGIVPALEDHYQQQPRAVLHAVMRPGAQPMVALADALQRLGLLSARAFATVQPFAAGAASGDVPTMDGIGLLVIDQFEELFTQSDPIQRDTLIALLSTLPPFAELSMHIVATLRADYLPDLFEQTALYEAALQGVNLRKMTAAEIEDAIRRPLNELYPGKAMEPQLVQRLAAEAATDIMYLPLLQTTLEDLWRRGSLRLAAYEGRTLTHAIREHADSVLSADASGRSRSDLQQQAIMAIFLDLVNVSIDDDARRDVRQRRPLDELIRDRPWRTALIEELARERLLSTDSVSGDPPVEVVDIIHEALIVHWERLRLAITAERPLLQQRARFELRMRDWLIDRQRLLIGHDLAEAEALNARGDVALQSRDAQELLRLSIAMREAELQRELERVRALAEEQRQRAETERRLRSHDRVLIALLSALVLAVASWSVWLEWLRFSARNDVRAIYVPGIMLEVEQYEVTNRRYQQCVAAGRCIAPPGLLAAGYYQADGASLPVTGVDGLQAAAFCRWIGRRLPHLDEWRYAGGEAPRTEWPPDAYERMLAAANFLPDGPGAASIIEKVGGSDRETPDGVSDLLGNVWEWTQTEWLETNAQGPDWDGLPESAPKRLAVKGGSYRYTRTSVGQNLGPLLSDRRDDVGFRCVEIAHR